MVSRIFAVVFLLAALSGAGPAQAFGQCMDDGYLAGFDRSLTPRRCRVIHTTQVRWRGGEADVRVIVDYTPTPALDADHAEFARRVDELSGRIGRAMNAMGRVELPPVTIFLANFEYRGFHAGTFDSPGECKVVFYKTQREIPLEKFLFTYSHELFHCMQDLGLADAHDGREALWWMEGSAEYFAHLANPGSGEGQRFIQSFDQDSPDDSLLDMNYPAVVFFLGLGSEGGPEQVRRFLDGMATGPGREAQLAALQARLPMEQWVDFGERYLDGRLRMPDGRALESIVDGGQQVVFNGAARHQILTDPYVLARETFVFQRGRRYDLTIADASGELRSRFGLDGRWSDPPPRVLACNQDKTYVVMTVAVQGDLPQHTFVVAEPQQVDERACCLIGDWAPTPEAQQAEAALGNAIAGDDLAARGVQMACAPVGTPWVLSFAPGATGEVRWDGFGKRCITGDSTGQMVQTSTRRGHTRFTWRLLGPEAGVANYTDHAVTWTYDMQMGPMSLPPRQGADAGPATPSNGFAFTCSADTLSVQGIYGLSAGQGTYTRIGAAPTEP